MPSLLASQLAKNVSLNAPLLSETARKKHFASSSYLFSASSKAQIDDLDTIHALALNALAQLKRVYAPLTAFDEQSQVFRNIFSQRARETDRTLLTVAEAKDLNEAIRTLTGALGCCLMVDATGRVIEWLVRRFRVNEFNVLDLLALFLPYHESPHFAKMVSIMTIDSNASWRFLSAYKAAGKALRRSELATEMLKQKELARLIVGLLPEALTDSKGIYLHRTLVSFNLSTLLEFITRADRKELDTATLAFLLPALLEPLEQARSDTSEDLLKDCILGSYILLAALSQKCNFTIDAVKATSSTMIRSGAKAHGVGASRLLTALISFMGPQELLDNLPGSVVDDLISLPDFMEAIKGSLSWANLDKVITPILGRVFKKRSESAHATLLEFLLTHNGVPTTILKAIAKLQPTDTSDTDPLSTMHQRYPDAVNSAIEEPVSEGEGNRAEPESLLMSLVTIDSPASVEIDWFAQGAETENLPVSARYLRLIRETYCALNAVSANRKLVTQANIALFERLGSDVLIFLAGLWTSSEKDIKGKTNVIDYVALRHASAFLRAQSSGENQVDFQVIIPALLTALQSTDRQVRSAALDCINVLAKEERKPTSIYAYDRVYGASSAELQYLDWSDTCKYLRVLQDHSDHLSNDDGYLMVLQHDYLLHIRGQGKKEAKHKRRVLSFILSHATCCPSTKTRLALLTSLRKVSDSIKLQMLLPTLEEYVNARSNRLDSKEHPDVVLFALESYDKTLAKELNDEGSKAWPVLIKSLGLCYEDDHSHFLKKSMTTVLRDTFFVSLSGKRQFELASRLIEIGSTANESAEIKNALSSCAQEPSLVLSLLQWARPQAGDNIERAAKKPKTDIVTQDAEEGPLSKLTFLLEVLASQQLPGSVELLSGLLDTLSGLLTISVASKSDLIYTEQLLMSCMDSVASRIEKLPARSSSSVRLDVLVEVMRTSENPQTFQQALLLMASLARLSPESVLHNIMPIFTFMGSNVFHRDDSHSFKVIQKTTESIVPVATASFREKHTNRLDRYIASRDLLKVFTDAFTHIPRHRRTSFFTHLVDVLDPAEFLAPATMLLADKMANRVPRQNERDAENSLMLPIALSNHYGVQLRLSALKEVISETRRLVRILQDPEHSEKVFLETSTLDGRTISVTTVRKRQCQTLLTFVGLVMKKSSSASDKQETSDEIRDIIKELLELATIEGNSSQDIKEVSETAQWALLQSMRIISVAYFSSIVLNMLSSESTKLRRGALGLLASRLPNMKPSAREAISSDIAQVVHKTEEIMRQDLQDTGVIDVAIDALSGISTTSCEKEESALTTTVPILVECFKAHPEKPQALSVVSVLILKLGPRILPYLHTIVATSIDTLKMVGTTQNEDTVSVAMRLLSNLLKTVPTFWGMADVKTVLDLYVNGETLLSVQYLPQLEKLIKLFAKQVPSKVLISSVMQCWPSLDQINQPGGINAIGRFFDLLKRCVHFAPRTVITENLRSLFTSFLSSFDARGEVAPRDASSLEDRLISSFNELVVKLNETAFTPLFRRLCDWAFGDETSTARQLTICRIYSSLLDLFKELMTPYMSLLVNHFKDMLESYQRADKTDKDLWLTSLETLSKSFSVDDGVYWRDEKLRLVSGPLVQQVPICVALKQTASKQVLMGGLNALVDCLEDDSSVKAVNLALLMHTRSEDARVRLLALQCAVSMWQAHGAKLRGYGQETATFIIECAEDSNDDIVNECRRLKSAVEAQVGKIDGL